MSLQSHLSELELQDAMAHPSSSDQELAELKRKKLKLKAGITRLEEQLRH